MTSIVSRTARLALAGASTLAIAALWSGAATAQEETCKGDNGGLSLPPGFCASVFADGIGHARQMAVAPDGTLYVNTWSGRYYHNDKLHDGGFIVALKDTKGDGKADEIERFGKTPDNGGHGGTGIRVFNGYVYAEESDRIDRYKLEKGEIEPDDEAGQVVVSGMPLGGDHPMHPFIIGSDGEMFVDMGTATNTCQEQNRVQESPGLKPCVEKKTRGGIWAFDANKTNQKFSPDQRYASGIRNAEGMAFDTAGRLFATQHGRDQLWQNWPKLYKPAQEAVLPSEELMQIAKGADYGWPQCYFDPQQDKMVLGPEFGGDGGKTVGQCADATRPAAVFPAHWAPNDLAIYIGDRWPKAYKDAAFIAFHGSWNRAPAPQAGYAVVVQPMQDGKPSGKWVTFADGFAGKEKTPSGAAHRPGGLAFAPDGALYISDDVKGTIWRVTYHGKPDAGIVAAPEAATADSSSASASAVPPEGIHPDAGREADALPVPEGATKADIVLGSRIFHGEEKFGTCAGCHGGAGEGGFQGPNLTDSKWLWSDGSFKGIEATVMAGVQKPKEYNAPMPAKGGAELSDTDVKAVSAYVWAIANKGKKAASGQ